MNRFGLFPFRSPLLGEYLRFLFLRVLRCFTSPGIATGAYEFSTSSCSITRTGLPHSETFGSKPVCGSPKHIVAYHVLHRLLTPSHPPQTLRSLTLCLSILEPTVYWFVPPSYDGVTPLDVLALFEDVRLTLIAMNLSKNKKFLRSQKTLDLSGLEPLTSCLQSRRSTS